MNKKKMIEERRQRGHSESQKPERKTVIQNKLFLKHFVFKILFVNYVHLNDSLNLNRLLTRNKFEVNKNFWSFSPQMLCYVNF